MSKPRSDNSKGKRTFRQHSSSRIQAEQNSSSSRIQPEQNSSSSGTTTTTMEITTTAAKKAGHAGMGLCADCTRKESANLITQVEKLQESADTERIAKGKLVFFATKTDIQKRNAVHHTQRPDSYTLTAR